MNWYATTLTKLNILRSYFQNLLMTYYSNNKTKRSNQVQYPACTLLVTRYFYGSLQLNFFLVASYYQQLASRRVQCTGTSRCFGVIKLNRRFMLFLCQLLLLLFACPCRVIACFIHHVEMFRNIVGKFVNDRMGSIIGQHY